MEFLKSLDVWLTQFINNQISNDFFDIFFPVITDLHKSSGFKVAFVPIIFLIIIYFKKKLGVLIVLFYSISFGLSDFLGGVLKRTIERPRPFEVLSEIIQRSPAGGYSFPSNHACNMFCTAIFLSYFLPRYKVPLFIIAILVSFSRIYNGVHYFSDVIFGITLGILFGLIGIYFCNNIYGRINKGPFSNG